MILCNAQKEEEDATEQETSCDDVMEKNADPLWRLKRKIKQISSSTSIVSIFVFHHVCFFFLNVKIVKSTKKRVPFTEKTYEICFGLSWRINREKKGKTKAENNQSLTRTFHGKIERKKKQRSTSTNKHKRNRTVATAFFYFYLFFFVGSSYSAVAAVNRIGTPRHAFYLLSSPFSSLFFSRFVFLSTKNRTAVVIYSAPCLRHHIHTQ